jgi:hypothetical protein
MPQDPRAHVHKLRKEAAWVTSLLDLLFHRLDIDEAVGDTTPVVKQREPYMTIERDHPSAVDVLASLWVREEVIGVVESSHRIV